jgi:hypothetical protein
MKNVIKTLAFTALLGMLSGCALLDTSSDEAPTPTTHEDFIYAPLTFRVKMGYTATFTYTPRDRSDAADYVIGEFEKQLELDGNSGNGYELAQGQQPDLQVTITVNSDDSNNKSMHVEVRGCTTNVPNGTSSDGRTYPFYMAFDTPATYRDPDAMIDYMADKLNSWISGGWQKEMDE